MTDLRDLLDSVAGSPTTPTPDVVAADARRGRRALLRRRGLGTGAGLVLAAAAVSVGVAVVPDLGGGRTHAVTPANEDVPNVGVDLVPYDGSRHGAAYRPSEIPTGWTVGGDDYGLLVAPPGKSANGDDGFVGKLYVYLSNGVPNEPLSTDRPVAVGDRTGYVLDEDPTALQVYLPVDGRTVLRAQAPPALHWDDVTLARFLAGVTVLDRARASSG
jgi:hypothetical protein